MNGEGQRMRMEQEQNNFTTNDSQTANNRTNCLAKESKMQFFLSVDLSDCSQILRLNYNYVMRIWSESKELEKMHNKKKKPKKCHKNL